MLLRVDRLRSEQALMARIEDLDARSRSAYLELSRHYWQRGQLPAEDRDLAAVCKVSVTAFRRMRVQLGWAFDKVDARGRWVDLDLEAERRAAIIALGRDPADFAPEPDAPAPTPPSPAQAGKPTRSEINSANAHKRWDPHRERLARQAGGTVGTGEAGRFASEPMQTSMQNGMQIRMPTDANGTPDRMDFALSHPVQNREDEEDSLSESSSSSSLAGPPADATHANGHAISHPGLHHGDATPPADGTAQRRVVPKAVELLDLFLIATGDNVAPRLRCASTMRPYEDLIRQGCDLQLHIVPEWEAVRTLKRPLDQACPDWMRSQILDRRDAPRQAAPAGPRVDPLRKVFLAQDSEGYRAWAKYHKEQGRSFGLTTKSGGVTGWGFAAEWPPGHENAAKAVA